MKSPSLSHYFSGMPELEAVAQEPSLSEWENRIFHVIKNRWPTSSLEIAEFLGHACETRDQKRILSSRIVYHVKKLVDKKKVISKRFGHSLIVWPYEVETLRVMHEMMRPTHTKEKES